VFSHQLRYKERKKEKDFHSTLLVTQPYSSFAEGRVVEGTLPLLKKRELSKILFSTVIDTTQPELK
jgi:hypothetical protein